MKQIKRTAALILLAALYSSFAGAQEVPEDDPLAALEDRIEKMEKEIEAAKNSPARPTIIVSGSTESIFEWDLISSGTGFLNRSDLELCFPLDSGSRMTDYRDDGVPIRVTLSLSRFDFSVTDEGLQVNPGTIDTRLLLGRNYLIVGSNPTFLQDKAQPLGDPNKNVRISGATSNAGITFGRAGRGLSMDFSVGSLDSNPDNDKAGIDNPNNQYAFGFNSKARIIPRFLTLDLGAAYGVRFGYARDADVNFQSRDVGISVKPTVSFPNLFRGSWISVAVDAGMPFNTIEQDYEPLQADARVDLQMNVSDQGVRADDTLGYSYFKVSAYYNPSISLVEAGISIYELDGNDGFLPLIGGNISFVASNLLGVYDIYEGLDGISWISTLTMNIKLGRFKPYTIMTWGSNNSTYEGKLSFNGGIEYEPLNNVIFKVEYETTDLNHSYGGLDATQDDMGVVRASVKLEY